jgi:hypothetical protein
LTLTVTGRCFGADRHRPGTAVVDPYGEVFGHSGLHVLDDPACPAHRRQPVADHRRGP